MSKITPDRSKKPLSRASGDPSKEFMEELGQLYLDEVVKEAKTYFSKRGMTGISAGGTSIFDSFSYQIDGDEVAIVSNWPGMPGEGVLFLPGGGNLVARDSPLNTPTAWINPRLSDDSFVKKAMGQARKKIGPLIQREVRRVLERHRMFE